ncbi:ABC transporter permease subunit [Modestobacter sp. I12A-02628]|uniref:Carbohydrate ABC transporter permease n=1 Tax=Goekera deserti TaxID=2497753 RepID=A0A7K3WD84_9ACTN|nr:carbohydrate ABC transporter permease [Goekera deserti]MPQ97417.1 ABC transporter permease subunit [Goekera deserti]NDI47982.1 ABC transporter permease subunit [Goekera deserti]NEL53730.1 carbohydrate ABC transporter permease [Goekera deserti]
MSSGTVATPIQLQSDTASVGSNTKARGGKKPDVGGKSPLWVRIVVGLLCALWIIPTLGLAVTSFRPADQANSSGWWTIFTSPSVTLQNYSDVFSRANMGEAFVNSVAITVPATIIPILIAAFAAYVFTFMQFKGRDFLMVMIVALLVVPTQVALVPLLKLYGDLGISGTFLAIWLAHIGFGMPLAIYLIRNYMATLPKEIIESAKIDGASHFQTFWRLIIPMSTPALASFAIFQFLWVWNDLLAALIFVGPGSNQPLTIALVSLLGNQGQGWQLLTAGGLFTMLVPILVFLSLQRYFVRGLTAGSVKG